MVGLKKQILLQITNDSIYIQDTRVNNYNILYYFKLHHPMIGYQYRWMEWSLREMEIQYHSRKAIFMMDKRKYKANLSIHQFNTMLNYF